MDRKNFNIILIVLTVILGAIFAFSITNMVHPSKTPEIVEPETPEIQEENPAETDTSIFVNVFFIGQNKAGEEVYKAVKRKYDPQIDGTPIEFSIKSLFDGPRPEESKFGVYSEIPIGTRLLNVDDNGDAVYINVSKHFELGGGTDSIYKRMFQLIKTVRYNTKKPAYLLIENVKVEVIGGDGIMLTQPLTEQSIGQ